MADPTNEEENEGVVDATSIVYIAAGIPAMVGFFVLIFMLTRWFNIPA